MSTRIAVVVVCLLAACATPAAGWAHHDALPSARVWVTTPDGSQPMADRGTAAFHDGGSDALTITVDPSLRYQRMDGFGASITDSSASVLTALDRRPATPRCATCSPTDGLSVPAPADGRLGLRRRPALHLRRRAGRRDGLRPVSVLRSTTTGADPAAAAPGARAQPRPQGDGHAVEPAGLDEDQRLAGRRPADRRPARSTTPTPATWSSSSRPTSARASRSTR